jgi:hypothetical protein
MLNAGQDGWRKLVVAVLQMGGGGGQFGHLTMRWVMVMVAVLELQEGGVPDLALSPIFSALPQIVHTVLLAWSICQEHGKY